MGQLIGCWVASSKDRSLDDLETEIGGFIRRQKHDAHLASRLAPVQAVLIAGALGVGILSGTYTATSRAVTHSEPNPISTVYRLAPSTLLEGG
jgi:hypothetical protein